MKNKYLIVLLSLMAIPALAFAQKMKVDVKQVKKTLENVEEAFKSKDMRLLQENLSDDFSVSVASMPQAANYIGPLVRAGNVVTAVQYVSIAKKDENGALVEVVFEGANNQNREKSLLRINKDYKIVFADYWDKVFGASRFDESKLVATIPFTKEEGNIIIPLRLNNSDRVCRFLFDSGANNMAIRASLADSLGIKTSGSHGANIVGGQLQLQQSSGNTVYMGENFSLDNQTLVHFPTVRRGLDGLIGLNIAQRYITKIDFENKVINLYSFGDHQYEKEGVTVPIRVSQVILLPIDLDIVGNGAVTGNFVFDTGANFYLIAFSDFVKKHNLLNTGFQPTMRGTTISMGHETPTFMGRAKQVSLAPGISYDNLFVTLQAASNAPSEEDPIAGSLGIKVIQDYNFTIDLLRKQLHLTPLEE